jgi:hypothetical protein
MEPRYSREQLCNIREQALIYQCACPAQLSEVASALLALYRYQAECTDQNDADRAVHRRIAVAADQAYAIIECCLADVLQIEGWDMEQLKMPADLQKRLLAAALANDNPGSST